MDWHLATDRGVSFARQLRRAERQASRIRPRDRGLGDPLVGHVLRDHPRDPKAAIEALRPLKGVAQYVLSNMSHETFEDAHLAMSPARSRGWTGGSLRPREGELAGRVKA